MFCTFISNISYGELEQSENYSQGVASVMRIHRDTNVGTWVGLRYIVCLSVVCCACIMAKRYVIGSRRWYLWTGRYEFLYRLSTVIN